MKHIFSLASLAVAAFVGGCAGVDQKEMRPVANGRTLTLTHDVRWKYDSGLGFGRWDYILLSGAYKETFENEAGSFYVGPGPSCLFETAIVDPKPPFGQSRECAIFVPRSAGEQPKVYFINRGFYAQSEFNPDETPVTAHRGAPQQGAGVPDDQVKFTPPAAGGLLTSAVVVGMASAVRGRFTEFGHQPSSGWIGDVALPR
jgi:hypothetical protein